MKLSYCLTSMLIEVSWCVILSSSDMVVFWQYVWSRTSAGGDADLGVALVPGACCHTPCHGVGALPGMLLLLCACVCGCVGSCSWCDSVACGSANTCNHQSFLIQLWANCFEIGLQSPKFLNTTMSELFWNRTDTGISDFSNSLYFSLCLVHNDMCVLYPHINMWWLIGTYLQVKQYNQSCHAT